MIQTNRKRGPRMDRILVMMFAENISMKELASRMGLTVQAVNDYFHNDDCKLSRLEEIADACGYRLKWDLVKKENQRVSGNFVSADFGKITSYKNRKT